MSPYNCYCEFLALKRHFNSDYDYVKYKGKVTASPDSFQKRTDKFFFEKLARHRDPHNVLIANLIKTPKMTIRDATTLGGIKIYEEWLGRFQSLSYIVKSDLSKFETDFNSNFIIGDSDNHPPIIKLFQKNKIQLETFLIVVDIVKCSAYWSKKMKYDPIWEDLNFKYKKYLPLIEYDKEKVKSIILDFFKNNDINSIVG